MYRRASFNLKHIDFDKFRQIGGQTGYLNLSEVVVRVPPDISRQRMRLR